MAVIPRCVYQQITASINRLRSVVCLLLVSLFPAQALNIASVFPSTWVIGNKIRSFDWMRARHSVVERTISHNRTALLEHIFMNCCDRLEISATGGFRISESSHPHRYSESFSSPARGSALERIALIHTAYNGQGQEARSDDVSPPGTTRARIPRQSVYIKCIYFLCRFEPHSIPTLSRSCELGQS